MMSKMKVALIETGKSHDECLYAQLRILKSVEGTTVVLICNERLRKNVEAFDLVDEFVYVAVRDGFSQWTDMFRVRRIIINGGFDLVVINTAQGSMVKKLMLLPYPKHIKILGILHNILKINEGSVSQRLITSRLDGYYLLSDYLLRYLDHDKIGKTPVETFYPIFYPAFRNVELTKNQGDIWICIPGQVERKRRDYDALLEALKHKKIKENIRFIFLGPCEHAHGDGKYIKEKIAEAGLQNQILLWDGFVDNDLFHSVISQSDYIMTLIHPDHVSWSLYEGQITGAYNLAIGYRKPMLLEKSFMVYEDFKDNAVFYTIGNMLETINGLEKPTNDQYYTDEKWSFMFQQKKYLSLIRRVLAS